MKSSRRLRFRRHRHSRSNGGYFSFVTGALFALAIIYLIGVFRPITANAQAPLRVVRVEDVKGPILGFSCLAPSNQAACYVLTRQY